MVRGDKKQEITYVILTIGKGPHLLFTYLRHNKINVQELLPIMLSSHTIKITIK